MSTARSSPWVVRTPRDALDARLSDVPRHHRWMLQILDGYARDRPYCWPNNPELARAYGCTRRNAQLLLAAMERSGLIERVEPPPGSNGREGIILRRRFDPDLPVADTDARLAAARAELARGRSDPAPPERRAAPRMAQSASSSMAQSASSSMTKSIAPGIKTKSSSNKDESENDGPRTGPEGSDSGRRRPEPTPEPPPLAAPPPPPSPPPTPTAGWRAFTRDPAAAPTDPPPRRRRAPAAPSPAELERLAAEGDRASIVELERRRKAAPVPELPAPTLAAPELLRQLATHPLRASIVPRAAAAIVAALGDSPGSWTYWERACREITAGVRDPESLATPLERTLKALGGPTPIEAPGRYFLGAVRNWDREHGPPGPGAQRTAGRGTFAV